ncbi:MAG: YhbY family RNA-binding protein [Clostridia bacterium]|nr:YhbY family RNA-binding protein [Clostridia bacterium]
MTTKQRAVLRGMASALEPILNIGKDGISDNSIKQIWDALEAHELIKLTVNPNSDYTAREACDEVCERTHAEPVQVIGRRFVIYRQARKNSKIKLDELC